MQLAYHSAHGGADGADERIMVLVPSSELRSALGGAGAHPLKPGVTFAGVVQPQPDPLPMCSGSPPIRMACQIFTPEAGGQLAHVSNAHWTLTNTQSRMLGDGPPAEYNPFTVDQQSMIIEGSQFLPNIGDVYINTNAGSEEGMRLQAATWNVEFAPDFSTMTLTDNNPTACYQGGTLHRTLDAVRAAATIASLQPPLAVTKASSVYV